MSAPEADDLFEGAVCNAVFRSDGMWYEATVEKVLTPEEAEQYVAEDLRTSIQRIQIRYKLDNKKMTIPIDYLRITGE